MTAEVTVRANCAEGFEVVVRVEQANTDNAVTTIRGKDGCKVKLEENQTLVVTEREAVTSTSYVSEATKAPACTRETQASCDATTGSLGA